MRDAKTRYGCDEIDVCGGMWNVGSVEEKAWHMPGRDGSAHVYTFSQDVRTKSFLPTPTSVATFGAFGTVR